jgi:hypothetical protein
MHEPTAIRGVDQRSHAGQTGVSGRRAMIMLNDRSSSRAITAEPREAPSARGLAESRTASFSMHDSLNHNTALLFIGIRRGKMTFQTRISLFDSQTFGVFDAFETDEGRKAHLKGPIAAALMQRGTELLARAPEIRHAEVLADKLVAGK